MGLWDVLRGQSSPRRANLDALFALPSAALSLEASLGYTGDALMVHGACSSAGCFAMTDEGVGEVYAMVDAALAMIAADPGAGGAARVVPPILVERASTRAADAGPR